MTFITMTLLVPVLDSVLVHELASVSPLRGSSILHMHTTPDCYPQKGILAATHTYPLVDNHQQYLVIVKITVISSIFLNVRVIAEWRLHYLLFQRIRLLTGGDTQPSMQECSRNGGSAPKPASASRASLAFLARILGLR